MTEECEPAEILKYALPAINLADKLLEDKSLRNRKTEILHYKAVSFNNSGFVYDSDGELDKALDYYNRALKIFRQTGNTRQAAGSITNIGGIYTQQGNIPQAIDHYRLSIQLHEETGNKEGTAAALNNLASVYMHQGDIQKALDYYSRSLKILEEIIQKIAERQEINEIKQGMGTLFVNIGFIYTKQDDQVKALEYFNKSLKLYEDINDKSGIATAFFNIGYVYRAQWDLIKSLEYYNKSLKLREEIGDKEGMAFSVHNIGFIYQVKSDYEKALEHYFRGLNLRREIGNKKNLAYSYNSIAEVYFNRKNYKLATLYSDSSSVIARNLGFPEIIRNSEKILTKIDSAKGNMAGAFTHYKQFILYRDSINNEGTRKASIKSQLNYEYEKKEAVLKEQQEKERVVAEEKSRFQKIVIWSVVIGLLLVILFAGFVFRSLKITRKQKIIIEEKQKEILDSIYYAQRIQRSLLPNEKYISKSLNRLGKK